jgi:anti-anti-sigma regulatory factor
MPGCSATLLVVCAYRREHFDDETIAEMVAVHPLTVGVVPVDPGFRILNLDHGVWQINGEVDHLNAEPFGRALAAAASGASSLRLRAAGLRFIAVAGVRAIIQLALSRPDLRVIIDDASPTFQHCWQLLDLHRQLPSVQFEPAAVAGYPSADARSPVREDAA